MTRTLFVLAGAMFLGFVGLLVVSMSSSAPAPLMMSFFCAAPLFLLTFGAAIGRASNEFVIERKGQASHAAAARTQRTTGNRSVNPAEQL